MLCDSTLFLGLIVTPCISPPLRRSLLCYFLAVPLPPQECDLLFIYIHNNMGVIFSEMTQEQQHKQQL